jgi:hypothetical protein
MKGQKSERDKVAQMVNDPRSRSNKASMNGDQLSFGLTGSMREVFEKLRPLHKKVLDGEMSSAEYDIIHDEEMAKL